VIVLAKNSTTDYENKYLTVGHFHRCWGTRGLNEVRKHFNIVELDKDDNYY